MTYVPWLARDAQIVRRDYGRLDTPALAAALGRSAAAVRNCARRLGLAVRRGKVSEHARAVIRLNVYGHTDTDIARRLGLGRRSVSAWLRGRGRAANARFGPGPWADEGRRRKFRSDAACWRRMRRRLSWDALEPGCICQSEVLVVRLLRERGPLAPAPSGPRS